MHYTVVQEFQPNTCKIEARLLQILAVGVGYMSR